MNFRKVTVAAMLVTAAAALAFQAATRWVRQRINTAPASMATMLPQGALLTIESPDFAGLLRSWNTSPQKKAWLASDNYAVFSNSRLLSRLTDAQTEFESAAQAKALRDSISFDGDFLTQVAGRQSVFAWYDVGHLEFLYITRMPAAQAGRIALLQSHAGWSARQSAGLTFYVRHSPQGADGQPRTVAYAQIPGASGTVVLLATREDLVANALTLARRTGAGNALDSEPWYADSVASLPAGTTPPALRMVLNMDRLVPLPAFRTYWVQQNISQMRQYRAAVSELYLDGNEYREERVLLLRAAVAEPPSAGLAPIATLVPQDSGVFRATATHDPALAVTALEEKLLGGITLAKGAETQAPDPSLAATEFGKSKDLETRIDTPAPVSESASNQALLQTIQSTGLDAVLTWSSAFTPNTPAGLWIPIHSAVVLHASKPWSAASLQAALQQSLRGALTISTLGIDFRSIQLSGSSVYTLNGPKPLFLASRGELAVFSDNQALLESLLRKTAPLQAGALPVTFLAGFDHRSQRLPYARLTSLIDSTNTPAQPKAATTPGNNADGPKAQADGTPAYFSRNLRSLSDSFAALAREHMIERPVDLPSGPGLRQTVTYEWQNQ